MVVEVSRAPFARLGLMGGCGSSGTTLLVHLLSRHPTVGAGPEFNCFNHPELYDLDALRRSWPEIKRGMAIPAGYIDVGVFMTHRDRYRITDELVEQWIAEARSTQDFVFCLVEHLRSALETPVVLEKSPTNIYCFQKAAESLPGVRLIHLIRDGRDVVVSLMRRGFNLFGAGSRWLFDTLRGLESRGLPGYIETRYEELVMSPAEVCGTLLRHLGVEALTIGNEVVEGRGVYVEQWLDRAEPRAWNQTPTDPVTNRSVGQYRNTLSQRDLARLCRIRLRPQVPISAGLPVTFGDLLEFLAYEPASKVDRSELRGTADRLLEWQDYDRRLRRFWSRNYWRFPRRLTQFA